MDRIVPDGGNAVRQLRDFGDAWLKMEGKR